MWRMTNTHILLPHTALVCDCDRETRACHSLLQSLFLLELEMCHFPRLLDCFSGELNK